MARGRWGMLAVAVVLAVCGGGVAGTPVAATHTWMGSIDDLNLAKAKPANGVITNARDFEKLVKAWSVADLVPTVNFDQELILVETTRGGRLSLRASLDDAGDLKVVGLATKDLRPGFRYVIISVPKNGVNTVNGKELPK